MESELIEMVRWCKDSECHGPRYYTSVRFDKVWEKRQDIRQQFNDLSKHVIPCTIPSDQQTFHDPPKHVDTFRDACIELFHDQASRVCKSTKREVKNAPLKLDKRSLEKDILVEGNIDKDNSIVESMQHLSLENKHLSGLAGSRELYQSSQQERMDSLTALMEEEMHRGGTELNPVQQNNNSDGLTPLTENDCNSCNQKPSCEPQSTRRRSCRTVRKISYVKQSGDEDNEIAILKPVPKVSNNLKPSGVPQSKKRRTCRTSKRGVVRGEDNETDILKSSPNQSDKLNPSDVLQSKKGRGYGRSRKGVTRVSRIEHNEDEDDETDILKSSPKQSDNMKPSDGPQAKKGRCCRTSKRGVVSGDEDNETDILKPSPKESDNMKPSDGPQSKLRKSCRASRHFTDILKPSPKQSQSEADNNSETPLKGNDCDSGKLSATGESLSKLRSSSRAYRHFTDILRPSIDQPLLEADNNEEFSHSKRNDRSSDNNGGNTPPKENQAPTDEQETERREICRKSRNPGARLHFDEQSGEGRNEPGNLVLSPTEQSQTGADNNGDLTPSKENDSNSDNQKPSCEPQSLKRRGSRTAKRVSYAEQSRDDDNETDILKPSSKTSELEDNDAKCNPLNEKDWPSDHLTPSHETQSEMRRSCRRAKTVSYVEQCGYEDDRADILKPSSKRSVDDDDDDEFNPLDENELSGDEDDETDISKPSPKRPRLELQTTIDFDIKPIVLVRKLHSAGNRFECHICFERVSQKWILERHMLKHSGERPCECPTCGLRLSLKHNLKKHMLTHTQRERAHQCDVCESRFTQAADLRRHMRIHTGEKPFQCSTCDKSFMLAHQLKRHVVIHTGEKNYQCTICKKSFNQKGNMKTHMIQMH